MLIVTSRHFICVPNATTSAAEPSFRQRSLEQHCPVPQERSENNIFVEEREGGLPYPRFFSDYMQGDPWVLSRVCSARLQRWARVSAPPCWCRSLSSALLSELLECCLILFAVASECLYATSGVSDSLLIHRGISDWFLVVGSELRFGWRKAGLANWKVFSRTCGVTSGSPTHLRRVLAKFPTCWPLRSALSQGKPSQIENVQHKTSSVNQKLKVFLNQCLVKHRGLQVASEAD